MIKLYNGDCLIENKNIENGSLDLFGTGDDVKKDKIYIQGSLFDD